MVVAVDSETVLSGAQKVGRGGNRLCHDMRVGMNGLIHVINRLNYLALLLVGFVFVAGTALAGDIPTLTPGDSGCVDCHDFQVEMVKQDGGEHAASLMCSDCHPEHAPDGENILQDCTLCHDGEPHYAVGNCRHCHLDPHRPLVSLRDPLKPARRECLSCHPGVGDVMADAPGRHAEMFCNHCHDRHGFSPECLDCHEPHKETPSRTDCQFCHPPHSPARISVGGHVPASACQACHREQAKDLARTTTRHGMVNCVYCHNGRHRSVTPCRECHGQPHSGMLHEKYGECLFCHGDAHRLISGRN